MTEPSRDLPLGRATPEAEVQNDANARHLSRLANLVPLVGVGICVVVMVLAWGSLPDELAFPSNRSGRSALFPKVLWPLLIIFGAGLAYLVSNISATNSGRTSTDTAERRVFRASTQLVIASAFTGGGIAINVILALYGGTRTPEGNGDIPPMAILMIAVSGIAASAIAGWWGSRRVQPTARLDPPVWRKSRTPGAPASTAVRGIGQYTVSISTEGSGQFAEEMVWLGPALRIFLTATLLGFGILPVWAAIVTRQPAALLLCVIAVVAVRVTGLRWTTRITPQGVTVTPWIGRAVFHVPAAEITGTRIVRMDGQGLTRYPRVLRFDPTAAIQVNVQEGLALEILRQDGTSLQVATKDPDGALASAQSILGLGRGFDTV